MEKDCGHLRVRLEIEEARFIDWREAAGLTDYKDGQDLPASLKADRFVLVAVLTEIRTLQADFIEINGKYVELQEPKDGQRVEKKVKVERKLPRGLNHIVKGASMAKGIARKPRKLVWVVFDQHVFIKLLERLTALNVYLRDLLDGQQARSLEAITQKTMLEIVQVKTSVEELKHLVAAAMLLEDRVSGKPSNSDVRRRNDMALASLAGFKGLKCANDGPDEQSPPEYKGLMGSKKLENWKVIYEESPRSPNETLDRVRVEGKLRTGEETSVPVWIEWKRYKATHDEKRDTQVPIEEHVRRVNELVALLRSKKPEQFCSPRCLGFFDDREDLDRSKHECRFGLVYERRGSDGAELSPISLHYLIHNEPMPSLSDRVRLAHKVATCVLYLHAVNWLHKALRSDSVLICRKNGVLDMRTPYVTGYEYARPDKDGGTTTGGEYNPWWETYVHPLYQGSRTQGTYRKTFDIYSLGIILLEIAYWKTIEQIIDIDPGKVATSELCKIQQNLLDPESKYLDHVHANLGDNYHLAVKSCIQERSAFDIRDDERETDMEVGARLQQQFTDLVVDRLESISV